ncbi:MAG: gliding motility-associated ABC transporter ATP-binding subunit GldA [Flavobacteriales bacterium]|nr:gliding motility-associated ABC transporter ATP-binding subunit GldA [Flavobacteriales bacterium]
MSIEVKNISKVYGKQYALDDVSLSVNTGEVVGFLGPNGAGKSTLMKILTTYINPTMGEAWVGGHQVVDESMKVRKKVGYLPEHNPLYLDMYVREYLGLVAGLYDLKGKRTRVEDVISMVRLEIEAHKKIGALSKGYRQRVGLAQAIIHDPEVLILDEPTSGLDPNQLVDIRALIKELGKEKTVMLSTHIMQEVEAICDRVIIIDRGRLVADKDAKTIVADSGLQGRTIEIEFSEEVLSQQLRDINGVVDVVHLQGNSFELHSDSDVDLRKVVFDWAVEKGLTILSQTVKQRSLEEVFKELTNKG